MTDPECVGALGGYDSECVPGVSSNLGEGNSNNRCQVEGKNLQNRVRW